MFENVNKVSIKDLVVNFIGYEISIDKKTINLTYKEFELIKFFVKNQNRVFTREKLIDLIWDSQLSGKSRAVDVHIRRLRFKLGKYGTFIKTVRNVGYKFVVQPNQL